MHGSQKQGAGFTGFREWVKTLVYGDLTGECTPTVRSEEISLAEWAGIGYLEVA